MVGNIFETARPSKVADLNRSSGTCVSRTTLRTHSAKAEIEAL